jgi:prepilin-type N-terminal cleavage/methylation domain-containing protein
MRNHGKHIQAMTLTELLVVMSVMVILLALAVPVAKKLAQSLGESTGARSIIAAAMSNARAIAIRDQKYAGVRFQQDSNGQFYLTLIINKDTGLADGFRAVEGKKPMKLPDNVGVMDGKRVERTFHPTTGELLSATDNALDNAYLSDTPAYLVDGKQVYYWDGCTFSIMFSPSGKLVTQQVRVCNKDGITDTNGHAATTSNDKVFNKQGVVDIGNAMFYQDDYDETFTLSPGGKKLGIAAEMSRTSFILFDKREYAKKVANNRWDYLESLGTEYVNPYTGELIKK